MEGTVEKWLDKGFGFIKTDDGEEVFIHHTEIQGDEDFKSLQSGQRVKFDVVEGPKGKSAKNLTVIDEDSAPAEEEATEE